MGSTSGQRVLLFLRSPEEGRVKTRLGAAIGRDRATALYRCFVEDTVAMLDAIDVDVQCCYEPAGGEAALGAWLGRGRHYVPQVGEDLGQRMKAAFGHAFGEGVVRAVVVGSDTPDLPGAIVEQAFRDLLVNDVVIDPSHDGGYYLLGFVTEHFVPEVFEGIRWSTAHVFEETLAILSRRGVSVSVLPVWRDVDTRMDLDALIDRNHETAFRRSKTFDLIRTYGWDRPGRRITMIDIEAIADVTYELARRDYSPQLGGPETGFPEKRLWQQVRALGTRLWLDTGDSETASTLWCSEFEALTTNNTLLNNEIQKGQYDGLVREAAKAIRGAAPKIDAQQLVLEVAFVLNARHGLRLVELFDAHVSVELHTDLGHDLERSVAYGRRYYDICPERFYVKVPLTVAGLLAARRLGQYGIPINFTLGFSARQNYLAALLAQPRFVNVFMGRLNAFVADNGLGSGQDVGEKTTLATQRELLTLREAGRTRTQLIGASMRDGGQVATLAGLDVFTMPPKIASQYEIAPAAELSSQVQADPSVRFGEGIALGDFNVATLWEVPEAFKESVERLLTVDADALTPDHIQAHFAQAGYGDLFPRWSEAEVRTATADGKIPVYTNWRERLTAGQIGLDALMNLSAFQSFATDQQALDGRIRSLI